MPREKKITFGEMRESGVFGVVVFCSDYHCSHSTSLPADRWPDHVRLSDIEPQFVCKVCGKRGADVRPDFQGGGKQAGIGPLTLRHCYQRQSRINLRGGHQA